MNLIQLSKIRSAAPRSLPGRPRWRAAAALGLIFLTGCRGAPSINVLGSFFPAWMLCVALGVIGTLAAHQIFIKLGVESYLKPRPLIYFCLWMLITVASWLLFFRS
ncbi:MAG: YtcA family lipoprotein [Limisphaerales bacterium]